jgi:HAE1 family hydrophobic/amphiphilic exporter-1
MNLARFSLERPVTMIMIIAIVLVLGVISFTRLGMDLFPNFVYPGAMVFVEYTGAAPHEVESMVTKPLEQMLSSVANVKSIQSVSSEGSSLIFVEFNWGSDIDVAALDMRERIDLVKPYLPDEVTLQVVKMDPSMLPVMQIAVYGGDDEIQLKKIADDTIVNRLLRIDGVASVQVLGGRERQINIVVDPDKLAHYGLSIQQLAGKLMAENINLPGGNIHQGKKQYTIRTVAEFKDISEIENLPITLPQGGTVALRDIADIRDTYKDVNTISRYNGKPGISLVVQKQSTYNVVQVANKVRQELDKLEKELPMEISFETVMDQADFIELAIGNIGANAVVGGILAVLVIFLFLRNLRSTLVIALSIPISVVATFVLVYFSKLTLNIMSLGGIALGIGMLVDNSIVVLENIYRRREEGQDLMTAAVEGAQEVAAAVTASTLTTVAVFLPIVFIEGITAQLFKELALTVTFSLLASLVVALSLVPLLSSRLLVLAKLSSDEKSRGLGRLLDGFTGVYARIERQYEGLLKWCLSHRKIVIISSVIVFVVSMAFLPLVGSEFLPQTDAGTINISVKMPDGTKLEETDRYVGRIVEGLNGFPEIEGVMENIGSSSSGSMGSANLSSANRADIAVKLVPLAERGKGSDQVAEEIREMVSRLAGGEVKVEATSTFSFMGMLKPVSVYVKGDDFDKLSEITQRVEELVKGIPGTREVESDLTDGKPELIITVDRDKAALYGLSSAQIAQMVKASVSGSVATKYKVNGSEIDVMIKAQEGLVDDVSKVNDLLIPSPLGVLMTLGDVAKVEKAVGPVSINRVDQTRLMTVSADVLGRDSGAVNREIEQELAKIPLPEGYSIDMGGEQEQMVESFMALFMAFGLAVVLVYMVMAAQFESLKQPFVIMFTVPLALIGVVWALIITGSTLNIVSIIGIVMLAGIVVNNAIVLIDFVNQLREKGVPRDEAIVKAGPLRLRPILMTTLTTVLALIPMAIGTGEGGELRAPMAITVVGGLTVATLLTLVVIPVVYTTFEDLDTLRQRIISRKRTQQASK